MPINSSIASSGDSVSGGCVPVNKKRKFHGVIFSYRPNPIQEDVEAQYNMHEKRPFSFILDRHIRVKVSTHALRCTDKAVGIDECLLKTSYHKMDTMGLYWKTKIQKMYEDLGEIELVFFSPKDEAHIEQQIKELELEERTTNIEMLEERCMVGLQKKSNQRTNQILVILVKMIQKETKESCILTFMNE